MPTDDHTPGPAPAAPETEGQLVPTRAPSSSIVPTKSRWLLKLREASRAQLIPLSFLALFGGMAVVSRLSASTFWGTMAGIVLAGGITRFALGPPSGRPADVREAAMRLGADGRVRTAAAWCRERLAEGNLEPKAEAELILTLAAYLRRAWRHEEALRVLKAMEARPDLGEQTALAHQMAISHALLGDLNQAQSWLPTSPAGVCLSHILVWARLGHRKEVQDVEPPLLEGLEAERYAHDLRVVHVMKAFCAADDEERLEQLALARPIVRGEFEYLRTHWPALGDFLIRHQDALTPRSRTLASARLLPPGETSTRSRDP